MKTLQQLLLAIMLLLTGSCLYGQTATYQNPILGGDYPDPTIWREGKEYYMTHSAFDYQPGLTVFHSTDLVHWEPISAALNTYLGSVWAPDLCKYQDKYYIYFTVAHPTGRMNFVTYADSPYGPWSEPIDLKIGNIDPCHVVGEDGTRWLFMSGGKRVKLTDDGLAIVPGSEEKVYDGWIYPEEWLTEGLCLEGPKLRKIGDYYYYLNAEGGTAGPPTSHMVVVARSKSINGPWENSPFNPLVHTYQSSDRWWSKGHGSLIDTPDGQWWIVYHAYENGFYNLGRQTLLEPITLDLQDGWFKPKGVDIEQPIACPLKPAPTKDRHARLNEFRLGYEWKFYKSYEPERIQIEENALTLQGKGATAAESSPIMFVAGEHAYEIEAEIELHGAATAGLVLYYNSSFFMGTGFDGERRFRYRKGGSSRSGLCSSKRLWQRLRNDNHIVTGYYSTDGVEWKRETWGMNISGYDHNTLYEFQSVLPGLFVCGAGSATFRHFKYRSLK